MEKISRTEFIKAMENNKTVFLGSPRHDAKWIFDRLENALRNTDFNLAEQRTAKAFSNHIEFCNGSRLYFNKYQQNYKAEIMGKTVYINEEKEQESGEIWCCCVYCVA